MARRHRIAVGVGLLMFGLTVAASVQPSTAARRLTKSIAASQARTDVSMQIGARLHAIRRELDTTDAQLTDLTAAVSALTASVRTADPDVQQARHELARRADDAEDASLPSSLTAAASVATAWALIQPLQTVSSAMLSKDTYVAALLKGLATTHRHDVSLEALADTARLLRLELELRMNELENLLSDATRTIPEAVLVRDGAPLAAIRLEIGRARELLAVVERADADLRILSIRMATRKNGLLEQLNWADVRGGALQQSMATVERFVGNAFPGVTVTAETPVISGVFHVCPVDQPHSYTDDFGAPRWAGGYHPHQGNDIFAPEGTPIRAPFDGLTVETPNPLGGLAVTVYGEAGYVYNAHLSEYGTVGDVTTGTIIGYVGNSGDAINSAPHDHFEWHPGNGAAVDPFPYLNAVCLLPTYGTANEASPS